MDRIEEVKRRLWLSGRTGAARSGAALPFVTISRESGAGGRTLAQRLLEAFEERRADPLFADWSLFDRALCERVAEDEELRVGLRELLDERTLNAIEDMVATTLGKSPQRDVLRKLAETVRELALVGKAIIVGRAGSALTRDLPGGIHLRLVAPLALRVERAGRESQASRVEVERQVRERDDNRAGLVKRLAGRSIDDPLLYDAIWNTERTPVEVIVGSVVDWLERLPRSR